MKVCFYDGDIIYVYQSILLDCFFYFYKFQVVLINIVNNRKLYYIRGKYCIYKGINYWDIKLEFYLEYKYQINMK